MSLLNDMLRDLETSRGAQGESAVAVAPGVTTGFVDTSANSIRTLRTMALFVCAAALISLGIAKFVQADLQTTTSIPDRPVQNTTAELHSGSLHSALESFTDNIQAGAGKLGALGSQQVTFVLDKLVANAGIPEISFQTPSTAETKAEVTTRQERLAQQIPEQNDTPVVHNAAPAAKTTQQYLQISKSARSRDLEAVANAHSLLEKNARNQAEALLVTQIESNPEAVASVQLLADLYFDRGARAELAALSANARFSDNSLRSYVLARHYALTGENQLALSLLIREQPHTLIREKYRSLQAALYQQTGAYDEAEKLYASLLADNNRDPNLWLGYALACDANKKPTNALKAYQQVLQLQTANPKIREYVNQRMELLAANQLRKDSSISSAIK